MRDELDSVWRALASPHRRRILDLLREHPLATGDLAAQLPELSRFAVMQHLGVLSEGRLVVRRRHGRQVINHLNPVPIQRIYERWVRQYEGTWAESLVALKKQMETRTINPSRRPMTPADSSRESP
jgi:DNA-binding transcriptional ArsR family regulator